MVSFWDTRTETHANGTVSGDNTKGDSVTDITVRVGSNNQFEPQTFGSTVGPVRSGDVIEAEAVAYNPFSVTGSPTGPDGPTISIVVP